VTPEEHELTEKVDAALAEVVDPCMLGAGLDLSIVDLGLVERRTVSGRRVEVGLVVTEPGCMFSHRIADEVTSRLERLEQSETVVVKIRWLPTWSEARLSARARSAFKASVQRGNVAATSPGRPAAQPLVSGSSEAP
jgi:metal-sulfur cluster biosynthetic enzyme